MLDNYVPAFRLSESSKKHLDDDFGDRKILRKLQPEADVVVDEPLPGARQRSKMSQEYEADLCRVREALSGPGQVPKEMLVTSQVKYCERCLRVEPREKPHDEGCPNAGSKDHKFKY